MKSLCVMGLIMMAASPSFAMVDSLIIHSITVCGDIDSVLVPVEIRYEQDVCSAEILLDWWSDGPPGQIYPAGMIPAPSDPPISWTFTMTVFGNQIWITGQNSDPQSSGRILAFYILFRLESPQAQTVTIERADLLPLFRNCDNFNIYVPITIPGRLSYSEIRQPGDANGSCVVNGIDVVYLVSYLKGIGQPPEPLLSGDANGDCLLNGIDVVYLVAYLKGFGAAPIDGNCP